MAENTALIEIKNSEKYEDIQRLSQEYKKLQNGNPFKMMAVKANAVKVLKNMLPDDDVKAIKANLENTAIGFKTDRRDGYPVDIIKNCLVEAFIYGVQWHGNEFNIISSGAYITKDGYKGIMRRDDNFEDFLHKYGRVEYDIKNQRAHIKCSATWKYAGKNYSLEDEFSVKLLVKNSTNYTTDDAIIGKAERKLRKKVCEMMYGNSLPDADLADTDYSVEIEAEEPQASELTEQERMEYGLDRDN